MTANNGGFLLGTEAATTTLRLAYARLLPAPDHGAVGSQVSTEAGQPTQLSAPSDRSAERIDHPVQLGVLRRPCSKLIEYRSFFELHWRSPTAERSFRVLAPEVLESLAAPDKPRSAGREEKPGPP